MKLSTDRILTTHVGSLPRPKALAELLVRKDQGQPYDHAELERDVRQAVADIVARQVATGIDVVSDGETSKIGYATYIKDRLTGFGGENFTPKAQRDLADYPEFRARMIQFTGPQVFRRLCCTGDVTLRDHDAVKTDIANFQAAIAAAKPVDAFMPAASPGVVSAFQPNRHYPSHAAYIGAVADAMQEEYEAIANAGIVVQLDSPDLAMARHTGFQDLTEAEFLKQAEQQIEALNHALANVPASSARLHLCWGNYEGPHHFDIPLQKILPIVLKGKPQAISFEAANPRHAHEWTVWRDTKLPDDKVLIPGVVDTCTNYIEHPELIAQRICQFADIVGRERVLAGTDCGFATFVGHTGRVDPEIAFQKLASLVEGAKLASARLWH
ncbi:MAG: cobalamin-independent methionine synthase II family protein [Acetobacteraceae bacterium]|jgi:5-methyltetrahydropteroyltriglutamate--homocysteine methyltransferase